MNIREYQNQVIWVVGASSGIGEALTVYLVELGATLCISARNADKLNTMVEQGSAHMAVPVDVNQIETLVSAREQLLSQFGKIDRAIFLSAIYTPMQMDKLEIAKVREIVNTNLTGAFNFVQATYPYFLTQKTGQIALCASLSGYLGLPNSQPYAATKAGLINMAESLRSEASGNGVDIKVINPGFVKTPLTDKNNFDMPFIMDASKAVRNIAKGLSKNAFEVRFPKRLSWPLRFLSRLPYRIRFRLIALLGLEFE